MLRHPTLDLLHEPRLRRMAQARATGHVQTAVLALLLGAGFAIAPGIN